LFRKDIREIKHQKCAHDVIITIGWFPHTQKAMMILENRCPPLSLKMLTTSDFLTLNVTMNHSIDLSTSKEPKGLSLTLKHGSTT